MVNKCPLRSGVKSRALILEAFGVVNSFPTLASSTLQLAGTPTLMLKGSMTNLAFGVVLLDGAAERAAGDSMNMIEKTTK